MASPETDEQTMHVAEDDLVLHYYGELPAQEEARVSAHVSACRECHAVYRRLQQVLTSIGETAGAGPGLPDGFERMLWARLEPALPQARRGWLERLFPAPARVAWAAAVLVLVAGAFLAGRLFPRAPAPVQATAGDVRERILQLDLGDHLERTQRVLVELVTAEGVETIDRNGERERAEQLLAANRLYRDTAAATGDARLVDLLDQLERVLVEVAASPAGTPEQDLDSVRRRIESGSLLFKVRVVSSDLQDRRKAAAEHTSDKSSL